jgi:hypothetical protein
LPPNCMLPSANSLTTSPVCPSFLCFIFCPQCAVRERPRSSPFVLAGLVGWPVASPVLLLLERTFFDLRCSVDLSDIARAPSDGREERPSMHFQRANKAPGATEITRVARRQCFSRPSSRSVGMNIRDCGDDLDGSCRGRVCTGSQKCSRPRHTWEGGSETSRTRR